MIFEWRFKGLSPEFEKNWRKGWGYPTESEWVGIPVEGEKEGRLIDQWNLLVKWWGEEGEFPLLENLNKAKEKIGILQEHVEFQDEKIGRLENKLEEENEKNFDLEQKQRMIRAMGKSCNRVREILGNSKTNLTTVENIDDKDILELVQYRMEELNNTTRELLSLCVARIHGKWDDLSYKQNQILEYRIKELEKQLEMEKENSTENPKCECHCECVRPPGSIYMALPTNPMQCADCKKYLSCQALWKAEGHCRCTAVVGTIDCYPQRCAICNLYIECKTEEEQVNEQHI